MKKKDLTDLKNKTEAELDKQALDLRGQITKAQMELRLHKTKNTNIVKNLKAILARTLSIKREKEIHANA